MSETMFYILLSLREEMHGYAIMQYVKQITNGRITLGAGTVYQSLGKLESERLIIPLNAEGRKKTYIATKDGLQLLKDEAVRIAEIYNNLGDLL
jgi:DNA-binding PadR family transcriptional regulator